MVFLSAGSMLLKGTVISKTSLRLQSGNLGTRGGIPQAGKTGGNWRSQV